MVRFGFELSIFGSLPVGSLQIEFELGGVISGHATIPVSLGSGSVYFKCLGPNRFIPFRVSVRVWIRVVRFGFQISGQFCKVYPDVKPTVLFFLSCWVSLVCFKELTGKEVREFSVGSFSLFYKRKV